MCSPITIASKCGMYVLLNFHIRMGSGKISYEIMCGLKFPSLVSVFSLPAVLHKYFFHAYSVLSLADILMTE